MEAETEENRVALLNDEELVTRAKADDQRAITELIHRFNQKLMRLPFICVRKRLTKCGMSPKRLF